jgi:hypothetical protein
MGNREGNDRDTIILLSETIKEEGIVSDTAVRRGRT